MPADNYNVSSWTPSGRKDQREYTTSSGSRCLVRDLELEDVIELGILDEMDSLSAIVQTDHIDRVQKGKPQDRKKKQPTKAEQDFADQKNFIAMLKDKGSFGKIQTTVDKVVSACVVEPKLWDPWVLDPEFVSAENPTGRRKLLKDERDPNLAYLDYVNFIDKMGIFNEVFGGMEQLQQFRETADQTVGAVEDGSQSEDDTSGPSGNRKKAG